MGDLLKAHWASYISRQKVLRPPQRNGNEATDFTILSTHFAKSVEFTNGTETERTKEREQYFSQFHARFIFPAHPKEKRTVTYDAKEDLKMELFATGEGLTRARFCLLGTGIPSLFLFSATVSLFRAVTGNLKFSTVGYRRRPRGIFRQNEQGRTQWRTNKNLPRPWSSNSFRSIRRIGSTLEESESPFRIS